jgi:dipeptidase E
MHLYLSSYRFGDHAPALRAMAAQPRAVVINNALDYSADVERKAAATAREIGELGVLGFAARELDLRHCFGQPSALQERLDGVSLIWSMGGNAFLLRRAFCASGLDEWLVSRRKDPALVYGGYSAGAIVVTPTLRGIERVDPPDIIADGYDREVIWDGVGLVSYSLAPHYESNHPDARAIDAVVDYFIANHMPFRTLRDGDVILTEA